MCAQMTLREVGDARPWAICDSKRSMCAGEVKAETALVLRRRPALEWAWVFMRAELNAGIKFS